MKSTGPIGQDILSQIRAANDIVDVIQWLNVPLKKMGASYKALCPFHQEKTPSFIVNPPRQTFHCFGCGVGGDVFKFVMLRENLTFPESIRRLAERGRVTLPSNFRFEGGVSQDRRAQLYALHEKSADWFHTNLMRSKQAEAARKYLASRQFKASTARTFRLGYALAGWDGLISWAQDQKIDLQLLEEAGLVVKSDRGHYDRFRDRLMIPIADESGRVAGFSGRLLDPEAKEAKYVNSPETAIFKKGRLFFGLDRSKKYLLESKTAVICEGQLDWIRCYEAGIHNVIAPQGTALTEEQARILSRYVEEVILCFDADDAGQNATWRHAEIFITAGLSVKAARMPPGEDPDSFVRKSGAAPMKKLIMEAVDVFEHKALLLAGALDMRNPGNHRKVFQEMLPLLNRVDNEPQRQRIIQNVSDILKMDAAAFLSEFQKHRRAVRTASPANQKNNPDQNRDSDGNWDNQILNPADYLLRLVLMEEGAARMLTGHLEEAWLTRYDLRKALFHVIQRFSEGRWKAGWDGLDLDLNDAERDRIARLLTHPLKIDHRALATGLQDMVAALRRAYLREQYQEHFAGLSNPGLSTEEESRLQKELLDLDRLIKDI